MVRLQPCLNPFMNQVSFYGLWQPEYRPLAGLGLNPFMNQVSFYMEANVEVSGTTYTVS